MAQLDDVPKADGPRGANAPELSLGSVPDEIGSARVRSQGELTLNLLIWLTIGGVVIVFCYLVYLAFRTWG